MPSLDFGFKVLHILCLKIIYLLFMMYGRHIMQIMQIFCCCGYEKRVASVLDVLGTFYYAVCFGKLIFR